MAGGSVGWGGARSGVSSGVELARVDGTPSSWGLRPSIDRVWRGDPRAIVIPEAGGFRPELPAEERVTQPLPEELGWGPSYEDLRRLERGEVTMLPFAGRYCLEGKIGDGGMSTVYGGIDLMTERPVAIKVLCEDRSSCYQSLARFSREGLFGGRVRHDHVVQTLDSGATLQGLSYIVLERLTGEDLRTMIKRVHGVGLPWLRARSLLLQICEGLAAIHSLGIIHRDVKTSNCFRVVDGREERVKLLDFGIATQGCDTLDDVRLEEPETITGTPQYMSPEQARGLPVDVRTDVYAMGIVMCELVTGRRPFRGGSASEILRAQIQQPAPSLRQLVCEGKRIDPEIDRIYQRAVAKEPRHRFGSITEMADRIRAVDGSAAWARFAAGFARLCRRATASAA